MVVLYKEAKGVPEERLILISTRKCNLDCSFCYVEKGEARWDIDKAKKAIDLFAARAEVGLLRFFGGEPLLEYAAIKDIVAWSRSRHPELRYDLTTNGVLIDPAIKDFLLENDIEPILSYRNEVTHSIAYKELVDKACVNFNLSPGCSGSVGDIKGLLQAGYRKFNFLPAYYVKWTEAEIVELRSAFSGIWEILTEHPDDIFVKNLGVDSNMPLFGSDMTLDCDGGLYLGNFILDRRFLGIREYFRIGDIDEIEELGRVAEVAKSLDYDRVLRQVFAEDILADTFSVDKELSRFCDALMNKA